MFGVRLLDSPDRLRQSPAMPPRLKDSNSTIRLGGKLWIERAGVLLLNDPGADLLEQIEAGGSLSEAARRLRFSYRRAWMLLDAMNKRWPSPLVITATGGKRGGGTVLTPFGIKVLHAYRDAQLQLEHFLDGVNSTLNRSIRPD
jgi:molybdate transport system regulatory protein